MSEVIKAAIIVPDVGQMAGSVVDAQDLRELGAKEARLAAESLSQSGAQGEKEDKLPEDRMVHL